MTPQEAIKKLEQSFPRSSIFIERRFKSMVGNDDRYRKTEWSIMTTSPDIYVLAFELDDAMEEVFAKAKEVENASA